jgi:hypothetical protein
MMSLALASAFAVAAAHYSMAAPVPTSSAALAAATTPAATDVRWGGGWGWRGGGWGWRRAWWPGAVIGGLALGAALATPVYAAPYGPYWGGGYAVYPFGPYYGYGRCFTREGGYRYSPCDSN